MTLCAIIGSGPVGEYFAAHIHAAEPSVQVIGLRATRRWLPTISPVAEFISSHDFGKCLTAIQRLGATKVVFAGEPYGSFRIATDAVALFYMIRGKPSLWAPHAVLEVIKDQLARRKIVLKSPLDCLPALAAEVGFTVGAAPEDYAPRSDLQAAVTHAGRQPWRAVYQTCIVDRGTVIMPEIQKQRTDKLIKAFGASSHRRSAIFPVLCKVAIAPFEKIDVPTIGIETLKNCVENGIRAIIVEGGKTILMQREEVVAFAYNGSICVHAL
jgi:UDP-2,3-diacylglucosamine hydrolase